MALDESTDSFYKSTIRRIVDRVVDAHYTKKERATTFLGRTLAAIVSDNQKGEELE